MGQWADGSVVGGFNKTRDQTGSINEPRDSQTGLKLSLSQFWWFICCIVDVRCSGKLNTSKKSYEASLFNEKRNLPCETDQPKGTP